MLIKPWGTGNFLFIEYAWWLRPYYMFLFISHLMWSTEHHIRYLKWAHPNASHSHAAVTALTQFSHADLAYVIKHFYTDALRFPLKDESAPFSASFVGKLQGCIVSVWIYNLNHAFVTERVTLSVAEGQIALAAVWISCYILFGTVAVNEPIPLSHHVTLYIHSKNIQSLSTQ